jgi:phage RecT family recombinase
MKPGHHLALPDATDPLSLPFPQHAAARVVYDRLERIPDWLPARINVRQFIIAAATGINGLSPGVNPQSAVEAVFNCAVLGLIPGKARRHAYFIPYANQVTLVLGYEGFLELGYGCRFLKSVHTDVVLAGEEFAHGTDASGPYLRHPLPLRRDRTFNKVELAYCIWHGVDGGYGIEYTQKADLVKYRSGAIARKRGSKPCPWEEYPIQMCRKTPLRAAARYWRQSPELGHAIGLDEAADLGMKQPSLVGSIDAEAEVKVDDPGFAAYADLAAPTDLDKLPPQQVHQGFSEKIWQGSVDNAGSADRLRFLWSEVPQDRGLNVPGRCAKYLTEQHPIWAAELDLGKFQPERAPE